MSISRSGPSPVGAVLGVVTSLAAVEAFQVWVWVSSLAAWWSIAVTRIKSGRPLTPFNIDFEATHVSLNLCSLGFISIFFVIVLDEGEARLSLNLAGTIWLEDLT